MTNIQTILRAVAVTVAALVLLTIGASLGGRVDAQSRGNGLTGTWYWQAGGHGGFYTYDQDGTVTGVGSQIFGTAFQSVPGDLHSSDHGIWSQAGGGFETIVFRMAFDPVTQEVWKITALRTFFELDRPYAESTSGTFAVAQWICEEEVGTGRMICPDPNVDDPDVDWFTAPSFTWTQTRVRLP
jgi:hypothetical protein